MKLSPINFLNNLGQQRAISNKNKFAFFFLKFYPFENIQNEQMILYFGKTSNMHQCMIILYLKFFSIFLTNRLIIFIFLKIDSIMDNRYFFCSSYFFRKHPISCYLCNGHIVLSCFYVECSNFPFYSLTFVTLIISSSMSMYTNSCYSFFLCNWDNKRIIRHMNMEKVIIVMFREKAKHFLPKREHGFKRQ